MSNNNDKNDNKLDPLPPFHNCHTGSVVLWLVLLKGTKSGLKNFATWRSFDMGGGVKSHLGDLSGQRDWGNPSVVSTIISKYSKCLQKNKMRIKIKNEVRIS